MLALGHAASFEDDLFRLEQSLEQWCEPVGHMQGSSWHCRHNPVVLPLLAE